jgi:aryl-alcohol dehydrogenase
VPKEFPLETLGPLGCGVQTGAGTVLNALQVPTGSAIAVFGVGKVILHLSSNSIITEIESFIYFSPISPPEIEFDRN